MKRLIVISFAIVVALLGAMMIWVYANFAERSDMARHSLAAFLIMPNVVRGLDLPGACAPACIAGVLTNAPAGCVV